MSNHNPKQGQIYRYYMYDWMGVVLSPRSKDEYIKKMELNPLERKNWFLLKKISARRRSAEYLWLNPPSNSRCFTLLEPKEEMKPTKLPPTGQYREALGV